MKKFISFLLTLIMSIVACFSLVACSNSNNKVSVDVPVINSSNSINYISFYSSPSTNSDNYLSKTITATIYPATAFDKSVDWEIFWLINNEGVSAVVTDYANIFPTLDGSLTAEFRCFTPFENSVIGVKVTTRVGNCSAMCSVKYVGSLSSLEIVQNGGTLVHNEDWDVDVIHLPSGNKTYNFNFETNNIFNNVTDKFEPNYIIDCSVLGNLFVIPFIAGKPSLDDKSCICVYYERNNYFSFQLNGPFLSEVAVSGHLDSGGLFINIDRCYEEFLDYDGFFVSFDDDKDPLLKLTITETNSNVSDTIYIRPVQGVLSISIEENLQF